MATDLVPHIERVAALLEEAADLARAGLEPRAETVDFWAEAALEARAALGALVALEGQASAGLAAPGDLIGAARAMLARLDSMTTEEFRRGGERAERERLRAILARTEACHAPDLLLLLRLILAEHDGRRTVPAGGDRREFWAEVRAAIARADAAPAERDTRLEDGAPVMLLALRQIYQRHSWCFNPNTRDVLTSSEADAAIVRAAGFHPADMRLQAAEAPGGDPGKP